MNRSRAVAILATYGQFGKRCGFKTSIGSGHRIGPAAVAENAARRDRTVETQIGKLISWRRGPFLGLGIEREGRLKEIAIFLDDCAVSIDSGADDPLDRVSATEALLSVGLNSRFALIEISILDIDLESTVEPLL